MCYNDDYTCQFCDHRKEKRKNKKVDLCTTNSLAIAILEDANVYTKTGHHSRDYSEKLFVKMRVGLLCGWQNRS